MEGVGGGGELRFRAFPRIHFSSQEAFKYSSTSRGGFHGAEIIMGHWSSPATLPFVYFLAEDIDKPFWGIFLQEIK